MPAASIRRDKGSWSTDWSVEGRDRNVININWAAAKRPHPSMRAVQAIKLQGDFVSEKVMFSPQGYSSSTLIS